MLDDAIKLDVHGLPTIVCDEHNLIRSNLVYLLIRILSRNENWY